MTSRMLTQLHGIATLARVVSFSFRYFFIRRKERWVVFFIVFILRWRKMFACCRLLGILFYPRQGKVRYFAGLGWGLVAVPILIYKGVSIRVCFLNLNGLLFFWLHVQQLLGPWNMGVNKVNYTSLKFSSTSIPRAEKSQFWYLLARILIFQSSFYVMASVHIWIFSVQF